MGRRVIDLELPENYFKKDRGDTLGARQAKFDLEVGDVLRFHEVDDSGQRTGRFYDKVVEDLHKVHKAMKYWNEKDLLKYGVYIFRMVEAERSQSDL